MKILFLVGTLSEGGVPNVLHLLISSFNRRSIQSELIVCWGTVLSQKWKKLGIRIGVLGEKKRKFPFAYTLKIMNAISKSQPDLIVSFSSFSNILCSLTIIPSHIPLICVQHGNLSRLLDNSMGGKLKKQLYKFSFFKSQSVIGVSRGVIEDVKQICRNHDSDKYKFIHNGLDLKKIQSMAKIPLPADHLSIMAKKPALLTAGRLEKEKNYPALIKAFGESDIRRETQLIILGDGPDRVKLELIIKEYGLQNDVHLLGWVKNPYK